MSGLLRRQVVGVRSPTSTVNKAYSCYRGYPIEQLAEHSSFVEVCYLLVHGELPSAMQLADWDHALKMHGLTP